jgi:hypothetical protein
MSIIGFDSRDILRSKIVKPSWYKVRINKVSEANSKKGDSTNYLIDDAEIVCDDETGDTEFAGVPTPYWNFNSKAKGFMIPFFEAISGEKIEAGTRMQWNNALEGKEIAVQIVNEMFEGRPVNRMTHNYRTPMSK